MTALGVLLCVLVLIGAELRRRALALHKAIFIAFFEQGRREAMGTHYDHDIRMRAIRARVIRYLQPRLVPTPKDLDRTLIKHWAEHYHGR